MPPHLMESWHKTLCVLYHAMPWTPVAICGTRLLPNQLEYPTSIHLKSLTIPVSILSYQNQSHEHDGTYKKLQYHLIGQTFEQQ